MNKIITLLSELPDPDDPHFVYNFFTKTAIGSQYLQQIQKFKFIQVTFKDDLVCLQRKEFNKRKYLYEILNNWDTHCPWIIPEEMIQIIKDYHGEWLPIVKYYCFYCGYRNRCRDCNLRLWNITTRLIDVYNMNEITRRYF